MANRILTTLSSPVVIPAFVQNWINRCPVAKPYYLIVAMGLGAITVGFAVIFFAVILAVLNFNLLGWTE